VLKKNTDERQDKILSAIITALKMVKPESVDPSIGSLEPHIRLGADLGLKSLDFMRVAGKLQQTLKTGAIKFQELFVNADGAITHFLKYDRYLPFC
jgi:hypothetical protein